MRGKAVKYQGSPAARSPWREMGWVRVRNTGARSSMQRFSREKCSTCAPETTCWMLCFLVLVHSKGMLMTRWSSDRVST